MGVLKRKERRKWRTRTLLTGARRHGNGGEGHVGKHRGRTQPLMVGSSVGRARDCYSQGRRFEPCPISDVLGSHVS